MLTRIVHPTPPDVVHLVRQGKGTVYLGDVDREHRFVALLLLKRPELGGWW